MSADRAAGCRDTAAAARVTIQQIIQQHGRQYLARRSRQLPLSQGKRGVLKDLAACRTGAFGSHRRQCTECEWSETLPNSCRNRHCGTCGGPVRAKWTQKLLPKLLPTSHMQVVFTLPQELIPLTLTQPRVLYDILFRAAWATLQQLAADPRHLGARLGALAVLHTWNQEMQPHPHVHFVIPAGGLSLDGTTWLPFHQAKPQPNGQPGAFYLIPYQVLSRVFRGKFLAELRAAYDSGALIHRSLPERWRERSQFDRRCSELSAREWVVYQQSPPPNLEPAALVKYLARYVSGVAISDKRLVSCEGGQVTFTVKNRKKRNRLEERTISVTDFLSRFLQHVLPSGFTRVRYYGIYSTGNASRRERCRELLLATAPTAGASGAVPSVTPSEPVSTESSTSLPVATPTPTATASPDSASVRATALLCAVCHQGVMRVVEEWPIPKWKVRCAPLCRTPVLSRRLPSRVQDSGVPASPIQEDSS